MWRCRLELRLLLSITQKHGGANVETSCTCHDVIVELTVLVITRLKILAIGSLASMVKKGEKEMLPSY